MATDRALPAARTSAPAWARSARVSVGAGAVAVVVLAARTYAVAQTAGTSAGDDAKVAGGSGTERYSLMGSAANV